MVFIPTIGMVRNSFVAKAYRSMPSDRFIDGVLPVAIEGQQWQSEPSSPSMAGASMFSKRNSCPPSLGRALEEFEERRSPARSSLPPKLPSMVFTLEETDEAPRYDVLTLRRWFNSMDTAGSGRVNRQAWFDFLRRHPDLKAVLVRSASAGEDCPPPDTLEAAELGREDINVQGIRFILRLWRELDTSNSGTLEWEQFVEFFRIAGHLQEYVTKNPKQTLAEKLRVINEDCGSVDAKELDSLHLLKNKHLALDKRRRLEYEIQVRSSKGERAQQLVSHSQTQVLPQLAMSPPPVGKTPPLCKSQKHAAKVDDPPRLAWVA